MGKTSVGAKAGAIGGILYGIISGVVGIIGLVLFKSQIISALGTYISKNPIFAENGYTAQKLYNQYMISGTAVDIVLGIILGLVVGILYMHAKDRLPGSGSVFSGMLAGLILWVILGLFLTISTINKYGASYFALHSGGSLIASLLYGAILAVLSGRFERSDRMIIEPSGKGS